MSPEPPDTSGPDNEPGPSGPTNDAGPASPNQVDETALGPPSKVDELASAHLDGELGDPDEAARAETDPDVAARRETFREVSARVGAPSSAPAETTRDDRVAAALAATAPGTGAGAERTGSARPSPPEKVAARRPRRRRRARWLPPPAAAATVLVLLAVVGLTFVLVGTRSSGTRDAAQEAQSAAEGADGADGADLGALSEGGAESRRDAGQGRTTGEANAARDVGPRSKAASGEITVPDLGAFADRSALTTVLGQVDPATLQPPSDGDTTTLQRGTVDRCESALVAIPGTDLEARSGVAAAELAGRDVVVYANRARNRPEEGRFDQLTVIEPTRCEVLFAVRP